MGMTARLGLKHKSTIDVIKRKFCRNGDDSPLGIETTWNVDIVLSFFAVEMGMTARLGLKQSL